MFTLVTTVLVDYKEDELLFFLVHKVQNLPFLPLVGFLLICCLW